MPGFTKNAGNTTPFGNWNFLRSTRDLKTESYTVAAASVPTETIDGTTQKILRKGEALAKITSGADIGKVGPYQPGSPVNEVQTLTRTSTAGTVTLNLNGAGPTGTIPATAAGFTADAVKAALVTLPNLEADDITVTGAAGGPLTVTFVGKDFAGQDVPLLVVDNTLATGGTIVAAQVTAGSPGAGGATDGRGDPLNIVGLNNTFLPWQLLERDVEVAAVYECAAVQAKCSERNAAGARVALSDATATNMRNAKGVSILFK